MRETYPPDALFAPDDFDFCDLEEEIRVDRLCSQFLRQFYLNLVEEQELEPEVAARLAYGADYFLREFIIGDRQENILRIPPRRVNQFAGNWYIIKNMEPNMEELAVHLEGIRRFYAYCAALGKVSADLAGDIAHECDRTAFYRQRIESFWAIEGGGYFAWERACTLKN